MADGEVVYEVRADTSNIDSDLNEANSKVEKGTGKLTQIAGTTAKVVGTSFLAVGTAVTGIGALAVKSSNDFEKAMNGLSASTGIARDDMENYEGVLKDIYGNNYGENFDDIATAIGEVRKNLGDLSDVDMQKVTESAFALRDTYGYEIPESVRAAKAMMENFGTSGEDAMNLIAAGSQNGLDYSGELIDSINEYSSQFGKLGFTADDMFNIFQKGADNGAWNLDKVGDAVKEFSIRAIDGSTTTIDGFTKIGLNADDMAGKFAQGGDTAKQAFKDTVKALSEMEDPIAQNTAGVDLFGTMWEDLGPEAVSALADIEDGAYGTGDALDKIKEVKYDDLGSALEGLKRNFELLIQPLGDALIPLIEDFVNEILPKMQEQMQPIVDKMVEFLPSLLSLVGEILPLLFNLITQIMPFVLQIGEAYLPILIDAFNQLIPPIMSIISQLLPPLLDLLTTLMPVILEIETSLMPALISVFQALMPPILDLIDQLLPPLMALLESLMPCIEALTPVITTLAELFAVKLQQAINNVMPVISGVMQTLSYLLDFITNVFQGNWEGAWDSIVGYFRSVFENVANVAAMAINNVVDTINGMLGGINNVTAKVGIPSIPEIPHVPTFHVGGIVDFDQSEGMALLKSGEMVLTAQQQKQLFDMANGFVSPQANGTYGGVTSNNKQATITNSYNFNVRNDTDIQKISQELAKLQSREVLAIGGKK